VLLRVAAVVCAMAFAIPPSAAALTAGPKLPLGQSGRWMVDAEGRVFITHGGNMVSNDAPYYPSAFGFGTDDAAFIRSLGLNSVRLGIQWRGVEPQPGVYDDHYIAKIIGTVRMLARFGILSQIDFHQDEWSPEVGGLDGEPAWATLTNGAPNTKGAFPEGYFSNPALWRAFENFWANSPGPGGVGLQDRYAAAWHHVALELAPVRADLLGYDVMNEPFPGSTYAECGAPSGCPGFDISELTAMYRRVTREIRTADPRSIIWGEPNVSYDFGFVTNLGTWDAHDSGFAFHEYCLSQFASQNEGSCSSEAQSIQMAVQHVRSTHQALLMNEWGAMDDVPSLEAIVSLADRQMLPWIHFAYSGGITGGWPNSPEFLVYDTSKPPTGSNVNRQIETAIVEPYPQLIAGTPLSWGFDRSSDTFTVRYSTTRVSGSGVFPAGSVTAVVVPAFVFTHRYSAHVVGGAIVSARNARALQIVSCPHTSRLSVTVGPDGASAQSCRPRLHIQLRPKAVRLGKGTGYRFAVIATLGTYSVPVEGAVVALDGHTAKTGKHGHASIQLTLRRVRTYIATIRAQGYRTAHVTLRAR
jgi:endoglycosylceramidase